MVSVKPHQPRHSCAGPPEWGEGMQNNNLEAPPAHIRVSDQARRANTHDHDLVILRVGHHKAAQSKRILCRLGKRDMR